MVSCAHAATLPLTKSRRKFLIDFKTTFPRIAVLVRTAAEERDQSRRISKADEGRRGEVVAGRMVRAAAVNEGHPYADVIACTSGMN
jgi:hypothetical protein